MQKKGFTLLELIIVVIIIGILASVALPQYTKVREKAIAAEGINILGAVRSAQLRYYTDYGGYASSISGLDTTFPQSSNFSILFAKDGSDSCLGMIVRKGALYVLYIGINGQTLCFSSKQSCPSGIEPYVDSCS